MPFPTLAVFLLGLSILAGCGKPPEPTPTGFRPQVLSSKELKPLGEFEVVSGKLILTDPGYDIQAVRGGLGAEISKAMPGTWRAGVTLKKFEGDEFICFAELLAWHSTIGELDALSWIEGPTFLGVDSGQMGIFEAAKFRDVTIVPPDQKWTFGDGRSQPAIEEDLWYSLCCEIANPEGGGTITGGVISRSGNGDGSYGYFLARNSEGSVVGVRIIFVDDEGRG